MTKQKLCSHCQSPSEPFSLTGKRLIKIGKEEALLPYALCLACSAKIRAVSRRAYNNKPNADRDKIKALFWKKVDRILKGGT